MAKFKPGESGNPKGRPKGSKNRLAETFIEELANDFEEHGADVIEKVRQQRPSEYLRICASLVPKDLNVKGGGKPYAFVMGSPISEPEWLENHGNSLEELSDETLELIASGKLTFADDTKPDAC